MKKNIVILTLILLLAGAATYSFNVLKFSEKLGMVFQDSGTMQRGQAGPPAHRASNGSEKRGRQGATSLWEGLFEMGAYFSVFAFVVMLAYYAETLFKNRASSKRVYARLQGNYCKSG